MSFGDRRGWKDTEAVGTIAEFAGVGEVVGSGIEGWIEGRCFGLEVTPLFSGLLEGVR